MSFRRRTGWGSSDSAGGNRRNSCSHINNGPDHIGDRLVNDIIIVLYRDGRCSGSKESASQGESLRDASHCYNKTCVYVQYVLEKGRLDDDGGGNKEIYCTAAKKKE